MSQPFFSISHNQLTQLTLNYVQYIGLSVTQYTEYDFDRSWEKFVVALEYQPFIFLGTPLRVQTEIIMNKEQNNGSVTFPKVRSNPKITTSIVMKGLKIVCQEKKNK